MPGYIVRFRCPTCNAKIKAPGQLIGQSRACPGCKSAFVVPNDLPEDVGPVLVLQEGEEHFAINAYQPSA